MGQVEKITVSKNPIKWQLWKAETNTGCQKDNKRAA